jgi:group I intron endonuclease
METILKSSKSAIYNSVINYGLSKFKLEIMEYCNPSEAVSIEQDYIYLLKPEYNILEIAGSCLGVIRSEETLWKMSVAKKGENHPLFGKTHSVASPWI